MCTVIVRVPDDDAEPIRLLAIRDEDPARPWDPLGAWWPQERPGVVGVRDARAGGAWLAADPETSRVAVVLNRADRAGLPETDVETRGLLALESVAGRSPEAPRMHGFNLVEVSAAAARVLAWDGVAMVETVLSPGTHMVAHHDVDDPRSIRIARWLGEFRDAGAGEPDDPWGPWLEVIDRSAALDPTDDRALIRDHTHVGIPSLSLLVCAATVGADGVDVRFAALPAPGTWAPLALR